MEIKEPQIVEPFINGPIIQEPIIQEPIILDPPLVLPPFITEGAPFVVDPFVIDMPGCVEVRNFESGGSGHFDTDPDGNYVLCNYSQPIFIAPDFNKDLKVVPPIAPEIAPNEAMQKQNTTANTFKADEGKAVPCPPTNPEYPIGSVGKYGRAKVTGWTRDLITGECLTLWEPIPIIETVEAYVPPPTLVAGVFATALFGASGALFASPLVKLLNKTTKPIKKKIVAAVKKKLGKTNKKLSVKERQDLQRDKKEISLLWKSLKK